MGAILASTPIAKPEGHAEDENTRNLVSININANDSHFAGEEGGFAGAVAA